MDHYNRTHSVATIILKNQELDNQVSANKPLREGLYRHYKGGHYTVLGVARHSETEELFVVYRPEYGEKQLWIRPLVMFQELIEINGEYQPRFQRIEQQPAD